MPVELRVLGPLEIRRDGSPVQLRASKPRTLLAALLVEHGRVVSIDRLVEALWPEGAPTGAQHAIETHATRLRALLGADVPLRARPPGYVLDVDPDSIDSVRFERLLAEARETEPNRAAARAADALALWRGRAFADFEYESFAQLEIARLEELRQEAEEERIDAELALGHAHELVGELEALVRVDPPRERRYRQLMVALYRSGRQQAALDAFRQARAALAEYGLEPSPGLRELERQILLQDPSLDLDTPARTPRHVARRPVSVVAVVPSISLDLDPEEHDTRRRKATAAVAEIAAAYGATVPEPLVLVFVQEDHVQRAAAAAEAVRGALDARVGVEAGEALVGGGTVGGPVVERARERAREGGAPPEPQPALERRLDGPFVGRAEELARLRATRAALVTGPPGIGKTRLAHELGRDTRVVVGRCSAYAAEALTPLREIAAALDSPTALDDVRGPEVPLTFRRLCDAAGPVLAVFDDVHWADAIVIETIEHLTSNGNGATRVVCLGREEVVEERPAFLAHADRIALEPLSDDEARRLLTELGGGDDSIVERSEGNPLFIEQLVAHATDGAETMPTSLRSLLTARLDRLTPGERTAVEGAAVVGREFDAELVAALVEAAGTREALAALAWRGLVDPVPASQAFEERFRFRHALIHEVAYSTAPKAERARLHERTADLLDARDASDELVGFHLERASVHLPDGDRRAARLAEDGGRRLAAAGMASFKLGFAAAAAGLMERAAHLLPEDDAPRRELLCELGIALATAGDAARGDAVLTDAVEAAVRARDRRLELRARVELAASHVLDESGGSARALVELGEQALPVLESLGDDRSLGRVLLLLGWARGGVLGRCAAWEDAAERALAHYRRAGMPSSTCVGQIAAAAYYGPVPAATARDRLDHLLEHEVDDLPGEATVLAYRGALAAMLREPDEAAGLLGRARVLYADLGRTTALARTCAPLEADAARLAGDPARAAAVLLESCTLLREQRNWNHFATQAASLADALHADGRTDEARVWAAEAEARTLAEDAWAQIAWRTVRAQLDGSEPLAREAVALAMTTDLVGAQAAALLAVGTDSARAEALALLEAKGNVAAIAVATAATPPPATG